MAPPVQETPRMSKIAWTPAEYALLLRAWLDVLEQDATDANGSSDSSTSKSKAPVKTRVYERFCEISEGSSKRTLNATTLQRAVLSFNFSFISQYNQAHGSNAWTALSRDEREQVYNREKTTSYYFVDLDPGMLASLTAIRKHIASGSAKAAAAAASGPGSGKPLGRPPKKRNPKPKAETSNARDVYRTIIDVKGSDENEDISESDTSESSYGNEDESDLSSEVTDNRRVKKRAAKHHHRRDHTAMKRLKSYGEAAILDALDAIKKDVRRLAAILDALKKDVRRVEKLTSTRREASPVAEKTKSHSNNGGEKARRVQASKPRLKTNS